MSWFIRRDSFVGPSRGRTQLIRDEDTGEPQAFPTQAQAEAAAAKLREMDAQLFGEESPYTFVVIGED
jgi:hypothetical protein